MPPFAVSRTTKSRLQRHRGLPAALTALAIAAAVSLWGGQVRPLQAQVADGLPVFFTQTPPILRPDYTGTVQLEIVYTGSVPDHLRVFHFRGGTFLFDQFPPVQTSTIGTRTVTIFRPSWTMGDFVRRFGLTIDFDGGIGAAVPIALSTVPRRPDGFPTVAHDVFMRAMSATVGSVPVVQIDATAQYSSHVVNLVVPGSANSISSPGGAGVAQFFYSYFGDDYERLAYVFSEGNFLHASGAGSSIVQNKISGINIPLRNQSASFGSAGNLRLTPLGGLEWEAVRVPEPTQIPPLLAYAMGRLPASAVPPMETIAG